MDQPTATPTRKVTAQAVSGVASVLLIYVLGLVGVDLPADVAAAIVVVLSFVASYMTKEKLIEAIDDLSDITDAARELAEDDK